MARPPPRMQLGLALAVPAEPVAKPKMRLCSRCKSPRPESDFSKDASSPGGVDPRCKECHRERKGRQGGPRTHVYKNCHECSVNGFRFCGTCKTHKMPDQFRVIAGAKYGTHTRCIVCELTKQRSKVTRLSAACLVCGASFVMLGKHSKLCGAKECSKEHGRRRSLNRLLSDVYKITEADYQRMLSEQDGKCAICRTDDPKLPMGRGSKRLCIDHDHATGKVRGLLCSPCNTGIGHFGDNTENLAAAVRYLLRHKGNQ